MTTLERLTQLMVTNYKIDAARLTPDEPLQALGIDSLGMVELLFMIEDEFQLKLPSDADTLPTLADAVRFIDGLLAAQHGALAPSPQAPPPH